MQPQLSWNGFGPSIALTETPPESIELYCCRIIKSTQGLLQQWSISQCQCIAALQQDIVELCKPHLSSLGKLKYCMYNLNVISSHCCIWHNREQTAVKYGEQYMSFSSIHQDVCDCMNWVHTYVRIYICFFG